jgi:hypothetical protein
MFTRALIVCVMAALLAGCGGGPSPSGASTGTVTGHVQLRACGGAYRAGETSCTPQPYADVTLMFSLTPAAGTGSTRSVTTDASGFYRIDLSPGTYTVQPSGPGKFASGPRQVVVTTGKTVTADFVYTIQLL